MAAVRKREYADVSICAYSDQEGDELRRRLDAHDISYYDMAPCARETGPTLFWGSHAYSSEDGINLVINFYSRPKPCSGI